MKFWEKLLNSIFSSEGKSFAKRYQRRTLESVLSNSLRVLNPEMVQEIRAYIVSQQTPQGGFSDRGGKCDLYYSFFGFFVAEALSMKEIYPALQQYVKKVAESEKLEGVNLFCCVILYAKLFGSNSVPRKLKKQTANILGSNKGKAPEYISFMGVLALYYVNNFWGIFNLIKPFTRKVSQREMPCPVLAATIVLMETIGKKSDILCEKLWKFYRNNGGFVALQQTPTEDLLSTAVALFALQYSNEDLRTIKPSCLSFIDNLYADGGFCATKYDVKPDVEYTFYGLLGLGSLIGRDKETL